MGLSILHNHFNQESEPHFTEFLGGWHRHRVTEETYELTSRVIY